MSQLSLANFPFHDTVNAGHAMMFLKQTAAVATEDAEPAQPQV